jgi:5-methylcytosine-specific restriction endonuclease McrA
MAGKERKRKICDDEDCNNFFYPYKTTDKYCSFKCSAKHYKPLKRTPLKPVGFTPKPKSKEWHDKFKKETIKGKKRAEKRIEKNEFEREFSKAKVKVKKRVVAKHGKLCCEKCTKEYSIAFSTHHIIYRSERPKHPMLNNLANLIYLCYECHESFHQVKVSRNYLIQERNLTEYFGSIWGYDPDINYDE